VRDLLVVEVGVPDERLPDEGAEEDRQERQAERVLAGEPPHWASAPTTIA
jgi:hypothetical protein